MGARLTFRSLCSWGPWQRGMYVAALAVLGKTAAVAAQGLSGEPPLPLRYIDTLPAGAGTGIRTYFSSGGHPVSLLDSVEAPGGSGRSAANDSALRVLFIGNSLTYYNGMARMFAALAAEGTRRRVVVGVAAYPGASLDLLWDLTDAREVIRRFPWDYVVVQPMGIDDSLALINDVRLFHQEIAAVKARTVMWAQYPIGSATLDQQETWNAENAAAARTVGATVAPVPAAWDAVRHADRTLWRRLFVSDSDGHPSPLGSYLIALVAYQTIVGQSPVGLPRAAGAETLSAQEVEVLQRATASTRSP